MFRTAMPRLSLAFVLLSALLAFAGPTAAQPDPAKAEAFIDDVANQAFAIIRNDQLSDAESRAKLQALMEQHVAMDYIARLALGRHSRVHDGMTAEEKSRHAAQMAEYERLFPDYIFNKLYDIIISKFDNATVKVTGSSPIRKTDLFVHTRVDRPGQQPILADWRVRENSQGELKVIDVRAEGISLTITQRDDFSSIIGMNGLEPLLEHMRQEVATEPAEEGETGTGEPTP